MDWWTGPLLALLPCLLISAAAYLIIWKVTGESPWQQWKHR